MSEVEFAFSEIILLHIMLLSITTIDNYCLSTVDFGPVYHAEVAFIFYFVLFRIKSQVTYSITYKPNITILQRRYPDYPGAMTYKT